MKRTIARLVFGLVLGAFALTVPYIAPDANQWAQLGVFLFSYAIIGGDVLWRAARNIMHGQVFDENFLMCIATIGAFAVGEYLEGVAVMLFYQVGEMFQDYAVEKSRRSIAGLMDIRPDSANVKRGGEIVTVDPSEVKMGEIVIVRPGERIPLDGMVLDGSSALDTSALTGESIPREVGPADEVLSGCINTNGVLTVRVEKLFEESTVSKILDMVENASSKKAHTENFITRFARYYTPLVVLAAVLLAVVPPLILGIADGAVWSEWITRALTFLVISCPCALVISVPLGFFGGIGASSRAGVLVKGSNYLEALARTQFAVFDKTGTLTQGTFDVTEIHPRDLPKDVLLEYAAYAESHSIHPISRSLQRAYGGRLVISKVEEVEEIPGHGVRAVVEGKTVLVGNAKLLWKYRVECTDVAAIGTVVHVSVDGVYAGYLVIADALKPDAAPTLQELKQCGVEQTVMLTGDNQRTADAIAVKLSLDQVCAELLPMDKVGEVEKLMAKKSPKGQLVFVGDGINDAPVLARADIGVAMGGLGSDAAIEAADVVIMTDELSKLPVVMRIAKRTLSIVRQNIVFALAVKAAVLVLGACGVANMWLAVFADVGVAMLAILNSIRTLHYRGNSK